MTLTEFLLARIAEDEMAANEYRVHDISTCDVVWHGRLGQLDREWAVCECGASERVLAKCEAKRRIVELHDRAHECSTYDHTGEVDNCSWCLDAEDCSTLRLLALPYADHPDWREEWRP